MTTPTPESVKALADLADRVEAAQGPDREIDLAVHLVLNPDGDVARIIARATKGFDGCSRFAWELRQGAVLYEQRDERGNCFGNGGYPVLSYTASLDAAVTLVPEGQDWYVTSIRPQKGNFAAGVYRGEHPVTDYAVAETGPLALTAAALRAAHLGASHA